MMHNVKTANIIKAPLNMIIISVRDELENDIVNW